jgi:CubicO group peptidase (beta-lactamase class C family)
LKTVLKWTALAVIVAAVLVIARDPPYWIRRLAIALHGSVPDSMYTPRAPVLGGNQPAAPREKPAAEQLDPRALEAAGDYAEKQHSRALIVTRHGYIVFERYWQGSNFDTVVESAGLGRVMAALATGTAIFSDRKIGWPDEPVSYLIPAWSNDPRGKLTVRDLLQQGSDPDVLAYVLQSATGKPYAQYLSEAIWRRIGAGDASLWLQQRGVPHADSGFFARQGDWLRVAEVLLNNGNFRGDEVLVPRWVPQLLRPAKSNPDYGSYLHLGTHALPGMSPYLAPDVFVVEGSGNRMWLVPSLQIAILRTGDSLDADWDEGRIPNLIVNGAHDFVPPAARPGADLRLLVPNH